MAPDDTLVSGEKAYCFAQPGEVYAVYNPGGKVPTIDLGHSDATFTVQWYNPRTGGPLQTGSTTTMKGPGSATIGSPPNSADKDWVTLIKRK